MSVTVLPNNSKWQPSVLHLLPFSPNDAGTPSSNSNNNPASLSAGGGPPTPSYIQEEVHGFPALAITQRDREKLRSKSAGVHDKLSPRIKPQSMRAQSNGLSLKEQMAKRRAKSEYGTGGERKSEGVVKFSINDINEQILGPSQLYGDKKSESPDSLGGFRGDGSENKIKPLPKPALRSRDNRRPAARFWRSSCISPGELDLQKHKQFIDMQASKSRKGKQRVKLNVKDLPRCKTPIGENDPDKLNMKHVIAFLQKNADIGDTKEENDVDDFKIRNSEKRENNPKDNHSHSSLNVTSHDDQTKISDNQTPQPSLTVSETFIETVKTPLKEKPLNQFQSTSAIRSSGLTQDLDSNVRAYEAYRYDNIESPAYLHKYGDSHYDIMRPRSLNALREKTEFRLPASLRQVRETGNDEKPFRLHRFLTLVSNTSASVNIAPLSKISKHNNRLNDNGRPSRYQNHSPLPRSLARWSSSQGSKIDYRLDPRMRSESKRSNSEARYYRRSGEDRGRDKRDSKYRHHRRAKSQESHYHKDLLAHPGGRHNVICLPVAPVDVDDSDDDYNPKPTVPGRLDNQDVRLTAEGHAIIAQQFPHLKLPNKNGMRPHSVKDVIRWAEQKSGLSASDQQRPHSMKNIKLEYTPREEEDKQASGSRVGPEGDESKTSPLSTDCGPNISSEAIAGDTTSDEGDAGSDPISEPKKKSAGSSSPSRSEPKTNRSKSTSSVTSKSSNGMVITFPTEVQDTDDDSSQRNVRVTAHLGSPNAQSRHFAKTSQSGDPVKLTLRKERNLTRELTYMVDMELGSARSREAGSGSNGFGT